MPEGDTVYLAAKRMDAAFAGQVLTVSDFRVPRWATADLRGRTVTEVVPRGKHMLTRMTGDLTLHTHFEMDGTWRLFRPGQRWEGGPEHQVRIVLGNDGAVAVGYRIPVIELVRTSQEDRIVGHLGPDVLDPAFDADRVVANLLEHPDREIGPALLDQRNLAGLGNLYRTEACYLHGVTPWTHVGDIADLPKLVELSRHLIDVNKDRWEQTTTGMLGRRDSHWVFERAGQPCRRCGTRIPEVMQGDAGPDGSMAYARVTTWCPRCQHGPMPTPQQVADERRTRLPPPGGRTKYRS